MNRLEVLLIVLAALLGGYLHLGVRGIIALVASVWVIAAVVECSFSKRRAQRERGAPDEERAFLLMYLRDYAGPDGQLPLLGAPTG